MLTPTSSTTNTAPSTARLRPARRCSAHSSPHQASINASSVAMPAAPLCLPSTHTSQRAAASMGSAMLCLNSSIQRPGLGNHATQRGKKLATSTGSARPKPIAANSTSACPAGSASAKPKLAPIKGAEHGEATSTASTPESKASATGCWADACNQRAGSTCPTSNTPAKLSASVVNSTASTATT